MNKSYKILLTGCFLLLLTAVQGWAQGQSATLKIRQDHRHAQYQAPRKGNISLRGSVGLLPGLVSLHVKALSWPMRLQVGYQCRSYWMVGGYVGYAATLSRAMVNQDGLWFQFQRKSLHTGLFTNLQRHYQRWHFYGGAMLGLRRDKVHQMEEMDDWRAAYQISGQPKPQAKNGLQVLPHVAGFVGISYDVLPRQTIFVEMGSDVSVLSVGVACRM